MATRHRLRLDPVPEALPVSVCFWDYDRTVALVDGTVSIAGCDPAYTILAPEEAFARAFSTAEFDISELSFANHLQALSGDRAAYAAIPVFLSRAFRHGNLFIRTDRDIREPGDLRGKRIGLQDYQMTAAVVVRGILKQEYGLEPADITWIVGGVELPGRPPHHSEMSGIAIEPAPPGESLDALFADGRLDALLALRPPPCVVSGRQAVGRLFPDWRAAERKYYLRTGHFPIMHLVGIRRALLALHPWLARAVYDAFCLAKDLAIAELAVIQAPKVTLPWAVAELEATRILMGEDFWPYGIAANRQTLDRQIDWSHREGLSARRIPIEELFVASTLDT